MEKKMSNHLADIVTRLRQRQEYEMHKDSERNWDVLRAAADEIVALRAEVDRLNIVHTEDLPFARQLRDATKWQEGSDAAWSAAVWHYKPLGDEVAPDFLVNPYK